MCGGGGGGGGGGVYFFFQAEDGIRDRLVTGVQTCALPISTTGFNKFGAKNHPKSCGGVRSELS